jgi:hypothetical protein
MMCCDEPARDQRRGQDARAARPLWDSAEVEDQKPWRNCRVPSLAAVARFRNHGQPDVSRSLRAASAGNGLVEVGAQAEFVEEPSSNAKRFLVVAGVGAARRATGAATRRSLGVAFRFRLSAQRARRRNWLLEIGKLPAQGRVGFLQTDFTGVCNERRLRAKLNRLRKQTSFRRTAIRAAPWPRC